MKLLACIPGSVEANLGHEAALELRARAADRRFQNAQNNMRDFAAATTYFDDLWRRKVKDHLITKRPVTQARAGNTARADALIAGAPEPDAILQTDYDGQKDRLQCKQVGVRCAVCS